MNWLHDVPIKRKLTLVIVGTCFAALVLACAALGWYQIHDFLMNKERDTSLLADVVAKSTQASVAFQDVSDAEQKLRALIVEPGVTVAGIYSAEGKPFATFTRYGLKAELPAQPPADGISYASNELVVVRPISLNDKRIGTILLRSDLQGLYDRMRVMVAILGAVLVGCCLVAFVLSSWLQRPISQPIVALTHNIRNIAESKKYDLRLPKQGRDETGLLTEEFNHLLGGIQERETALRATNDTLREEVIERKSAEGRVQAQLGRLELLQHITRAVGERLDLESIFQVVVRTLEDQLPVDFCCVFHYEAAAGHLQLTNVGAQSEAFATSLQLTREKPMPVEENGLTACVRGGLIYEPDVTGSRFKFPSQLAEAGLRAFVAAPLLVESQIFGLVFAARRAPESFSSGECEFLRQLSEHVALAAHQAQLHGALQQAYDDLRQSQQTVMQQERLRVLGQMASGVAHDINNAISPVAIYTETLLEKEPNLSARARDYLVTIRNCIEDVAETVARLREFYRQREPQLNPQPIQINKLVEQVLDLSRARWRDMPQQNGAFIETSTELASDLPSIRGVESEIREALLNLVFNAVDAMPKGGTLTIRTKVSHKQNNGSPASLAVVVEVSDTGIGMNEDTRRRCLEPFFTTKGERGTGLGLAMVYGIAQRHSAEVEIESVVGKGSTFRLLVPAAVDTVSTPKEAPAPVAVSRLRILVIDDDPLLIKSLRDILEGDGHVVVTANGGQAGINAFRTAQAGMELFSVVITDLGMPYVDGRKVAEAIKGLSPATPVIMLTGWGQRLTAEGDIPPHVDRVLNKPPKLRELRDALAGCQQLTLNGKN